MGSIRRVLAVFTGASPLRRDDRRGLLLCFRLSGARLETERIEDFAELGPELSLPTVVGLGKVLRILRAARVARPADAQTLLGAEASAAALLGRASGTFLRLGLRPRSRVRFIAWTESGVESISDVVEILESPREYLVIHRNGRFPVRVSRATVVRQRTETERWYEVLEIERP